MIIPCLTAKYLAVPVMILFWTIGFAWKRTFPKKLHEIDLDVRNSSPIVVFVSLSDVSPH